MRVRPSSWSVLPVRSCTTRATIAATVRQDSRRNTVTAVNAMFLASHAQVSSNRYVHFAPGRAHGTCATSTPWSGHCTRGAADSRNVRVVPVSTVRHRLVPTPASYPGHDRRHCAHLPPDRASGRTDTTRTSPSPSGSGCMVTSPTTMPWTPINCPNTLVLRMPCPSPSFRSISKTTTTAGRGMSPQSRWSGTHYNVTRALENTCPRFLLRARVDHRPADAQASPPGGCGPVRPGTAAPTQRHRGDCAALPRRHQRPPHRTSHDHRDDRHPINSRRPLPHPPVRADPLNPQLGNTTDPPENHVPPAQTPKMIFIARKLRLGPCPSSKSPSPACRDASPQVRKLRPDYAGALRSGGHTTRPWHFRHPPRRTADVQVPNRQPDDRRGHPRIPHDARRRGRPGPGSGAAGLPDLGDGRRPGADEGPRPDCLPVPAAQRGTRRADDPGDGQTDCPSTRGDRPCRRDLRVLRHRRTAVDRRRATRHRRKR